MNSTDDKSRLEHNAANQPSILGKLKSLLIKGAGYFMAAIGFLVFAIAIAVYADGFKFLKDIQAGLHSKLFWIILFVTALIMAAYLALEGYFAERKSAHWRRTYHWVAGILFAISIPLGFFLLLWLTGAYHNE